MRLLTKLGLRLFIVTNQAGIGRGIFGVEDMEAFNQKLLEVLAAQGINIEGVYYCPYHPTRGVGEYRQESPMRKPAPGMLLAAAQDHGLDLARSYVVGDKCSDILAGQAAGCTTILLLTGCAGTDAPGASDYANFVAQDLLDAAHYIRTSEGQASK
ncbi:MAG: D-glycero-alpha-D-manno-heptose-1,7-bisphosphate 7-phosphatase [Armatimonadota bacterium]